MELVDPDLRDEVGRGSTMRSMLNRAFVILTASALAALTGCGPPPLTDCGEPRLFAKCAFNSSGSQQDRISPGDVFVYALRDTAIGAYSVVHGTATGEDALSSDSLVLQGTLPLLPARLRDNWVDWTERDSRGAEVTNSISPFGTPGTVFISFGKSHLTELGYPVCYAREP